MGIGTILLIILVLLLIGVLPTWPYSAGWGYYPGGGVGLVRGLWHGWPSTGAGRS